jgi:small conductance mechanosensitive channel
MHRTLFGLIVVFLLGFGISAGAQTPSTAPDQPTSQAAKTEAELRDLVKTLESEADRKKLISQLNALLEAKKETASKAPERSFGTRIVDLVSRRIDAISVDFVAGTRALLDVPNVYYWLVRQLSDAAQRDRWMEIGWKIALALAIGLVGEWVVRLLLARPRKTLETRQTDSSAVKLVSLLCRTVLDVIPIAGFFGASYAALTLVEPGEQTRLVAFALINANVLVRIVMAIARLILAPAAPNLRMLPLRDEDANYLFIWCHRLTDVAIYGYYFIVAFGYLGLPESGEDLLFKLLGLIGAMMLIVLTLQNRASVAARLRGGDRPATALRTLRARAADVWHVAVILFVIALYGVWWLVEEDGFRFVFQATALSAVIVVAAWFVADGLRRLARNVFALSAEIKQRYPSLEGRANRYLPILENGLSVIIAVIAGFALLEAWGIDSSAWLATTFGQRVTSSVITIVLLLVLTVVVLEIASAAIERYLSREGEDVSARAKTLLPLLRTALLVVLVTMFVLVTLSELGLNIAPLLAGAGVVGLAIGFGAQTLVKDIITGIFILMEDQLAVGDVVKVGSHAGVVERLSLRTIQLRDLAGTVHVVPFSEVTTLENLTKDFSRYVFEVGVAYREDTDEVVAVLHQIGADLIEDEAYRDLIVEPLEVLGVDSFGDNAVIIKARITTKPIKQWQVGREFNRRMKKRFDELGIEIPFPHRTIYFGEDKSGAAPIARIAMVDKDHRQPTREQTATADAAGGRGSVAATPDTGGAGAPDGD